MSNFIRWMLFLARYENVSRKALLANVTGKTARTLGPTRQRKHKTQYGAVILGNVFNLGKSLLTPS